jgi:hypothetical protein
MSTTPAAAAPPVSNAYSQHGNLVSVSNADRSAQINEVCQQLCQFQPFLQMLEKAKVPLKTAASIRIYAKMTNKTPYLTVEVGNTPYYFSLNPMLVHRTIIQASKFLLDPRATKPDFSATAQSYAPEEPPSQPLTTENTETPTEQQQIPQEPTRAPKRLEQNLPEPIQAPTTFEQIQQRMQTNPPTSQHELLDLIKSIFENFKKTQIETAKQHTRQIEALAEALNRPKPNFRQVSTLSTTGPNLDKIRKNLKRNLGNFNKTDNPFNSRSYSLLSSNSTTPSESESENDFDPTQITQKLPRFTEKKSKKYTANLTEENLSKTHNPQTISMSKPSTPHIPKPASSEEDENIEFDNNSIFNHSKIMRNHTKDEILRKKPSKRLEYQRHIVPLAITKFSHQAEHSSADSNDEIAHSSSASRNSLDIIRDELKRRLNFGQPHPQAPRTVKDESTDFSTQPRKTITTAQTNSNKYLFSKYNPKCAKNINLSANQKEYFSSQESESSSSEIDDTSTHTSNYSPAFSKVNFQSKKKIFKPQITTPPTAAQANPNADNDLSLGLSTNSSAANSPKQSDNEKNDKKSKNQISEIQTKPSKGQKRRKNKKLKKIKNKN